MRRFLGLTLILAVAVTAFLAGRITSDPAPLPSGRLPAAPPANPAKGDTTPPSSAWSAPPVASAAAPPASAANETPLEIGGSVAPLVERVKGVVVTILTTRVISRASADDPWSRAFGGGRPQRTRETALGSGFIIDRQGLIITNNHVVAGATEVQVQLSDERTFPAHIVGTDPETDVALVKMDKVPPAIDVAKIADSERLRVGDFVVAMGNSRQLGLTVTMGIVSAKNRVVRDLSRSIDDRFQDFIQTDAAINQGNSGGPLFNMRGEVVGVNTAILNPGMAMNVGFAIPINRAQLIAEQLRSGGRIARGFLGVYGVDVTSPDAVPGAHLQVVETESPAGKAGLRPGDVIVAFGDRTIETSRQLPPAVSTHRPGEKVKVAFLRGGKRIETTIVLGERREEPGQELFMGVRGRPLTGRESQLLRVPPQLGAAVVAVDPRGGASGYLEENDIILEINGQRATFGEIRKLGELKDSGVQAVLTILRGGSRFYLRISP